MELTPEASSADLGQVPVGEELTVTSWNIGFGAYTDRFSFFMDGGEYSRGFSEAVSYTHLDVYKRQIMARRYSQPEIVRQWQANSRYHKGDCQS